MSMMFRGSEFPTGICDELISGTDYLPIMCHSANIPLKEYETISGKLPLFFGGQKEKEYTITEIIYPGDPYRACIRKKVLPFILKTLTYITGLPFCIGRRLQNMVRIRYRGTNRRSRTAIIFY